jgi:peptide/nickel transport system ATP-binding protein
MTDPILSIRELSVALSRNGRSSLVLDRISLDVEPGEIIAVVGESGSGKTTLGLAAQGLLPRESRPLVAGSIRIAGREVVGASQATLHSIRRFDIRSIPQDPMAALDPTMIVRRQMQESAEREAPILDWLGRTGLADPERIAASFPHRLSGGQRQRVLIAMAMMARPKLLIADEPTTALDVGTQVQTLALLRDLAGEQETAVVFITHDLGVAASLASRIVVLYAGRLAEIGNTRAVLQAPGHPYTAGLLTARFDLGSDRTRPLPTLPLDRRPYENPAHACAYATRCPVAQADCHAARPELVPTPNHTGAAACFHTDRTASLLASGDQGIWPAGLSIGSSPVLELRGVGKSFQSGRHTVWGRAIPIRVLRSIDLRIDTGECVALVGESGAGKSTILRIAAGLLAPDSGEVLRSEGVRPQVVFQDAGSSLTPWLTIGEQIGERLRPLRLGAREQRLRVADALDLVGLNPALTESLPSELSGGQAQRAAIARAVVIPPKLLLCDEPISALDISLTAATLNLLGSLHRRLGMAVLFVTHDLAAARIIADRMAVLHDGELIEDGDPDELIGAPKMPYTRALIAAVPRLSIGVGQ